MSIFVYPDLRVIGPNWGQSDLSKIGWPFYFPNGRFLELHHCIQLPRAEKSCTARYILYYVRFVQFLLAKVTKNNLNLDIFMYNSYNALVGKSKCEQNPFENVVFFILFSANVLIYTFLQPQFFFLL